MNRVALVQVDGNMPNMALMQISQYHEHRGDSVEWWKGSLWNHTYNKIYASKIFAFSEMPDLPNHAIIGGTGIDHYNQLPKKIINCNPSYTLYPDYKYHIGFSMKGCRFACKFCVVPKKEGKPKHNSSIDDLLLNPKGGNRLILLDNDFFGSPNWEVDIKRIIELKLRVCFIQGLNIRIITSNQAALLAECNYQSSKFDHKYLTFAWDKWRDRGLIDKGIRICNDAGIPSNKMQFFVLVGYDTTPEQDYQRVMLLAGYGCMPYVMPYDRFDPYQKAFSRWVNNRAVFKSCSWEDYKYYNQKHINHDAQTKGIECM